MTLLLVLAQPAAAQLDQLLRGLGGGLRSSGLSDVQIGAGLKEALTVGTENTVALTGKPDGYFLNQATVAGHAARVAAMFAPSIPVCCLKKPCPAPG